MPAPRGGAALRPGAAAALALLALACARPAGAPAPVPRGPWTASILREVEVDPRYRQGLARVEDGWIWSTRDGLFRTDAGGAQRAALAPAIPPEWRSRGYDHIGDIDVEGGVLYAPLEQPDYARGRQAVLLYDAASLRFQRGFEVDQHENSFLAVDPGAGIAYSMDRFGGDALLRYDVAQGWQPLPPLALSARVERVQGADVALGALWLASDDAEKGLYRVELASGRVEALGSMGHRGGEAEGIDAREQGKQVWLRVLSIDARQVPVRAIEVLVTRPGD